MKDRNGRMLKVGNDVTYGGDLFRLAGEHEGRAILWPVDPGLCGELIVVPSELLIVCVPLKGFWHWLKLALYERAVPRRSEERVVPI